MKRASKKALGAKTDIHRHVIERSRQNDRKAQYELYRLYAGAMLNVAYRLTGSREEAEDMLQEAFCDAFRRLDSFRFESTFGAWLKRIVINRCINEIKRRKVELEFFDEMPAARESMAEEHYSEEGLNVDRIKKAMVKLPKGSRMIFSLYLLEGYDHKEIADILDISESNSKMQYKRAKSRIREILSQEDYEG